MSETENVDEFNLDESLNEFNAVIEEEIDELNIKNYFLKIRFSPTQDLLQRMALSEKLLRFTDSFYDVPTFEIRSATQTFSIVQEKTKRPVKLCGFDKKREV
jgi:hypothetical protein